MIFKACINMKEDNSKKVKYRNVTIFFHVSHNINSIKISLLKKKKFGIEDSSGEHVKYKISVNLRI